MNRVIMDVGEKIQLHNGTQNRTFSIMDAGDSMNGVWYKKGGSAICFDAMYSDESGYNHYGKLKKFYLADESLDFAEESDAYLSSYIGLHKIISDNKNMAKLYSFVPEFEIYYDDDKCPYLWTNNVPMRTFEEIYSQTLVSDERMEDSLFEIITTLKSLTDCIRILHENNLIHGDINPSNFGFYMRDHKILADGVSLFDLNTLRYVDQDAKWYTPPYYEASSFELEPPNHADIKAIVITLCKALGLNDAQIDDIKNARKRFLSSKKAKIAVGDIVFGADLFRFKGVPSDERIKKRLITLIDETVVKPHSRVVSSCTKLYQMLQTIETFLLPYCTKDELGRGLGLEIVNKEQQRQDKVHGLFQYLLYERPMYLYESEADTYKVLLIGFGLDSQKFLDVCLETAQSMEKKIEIDVWGTSRIKSEKKFYLKERPALWEFFLIDDQEELLTGDSYGKINFHTCGDEYIKDKVKDIVAASGDVNYIYIAAGNDSENAKIAQSFSELLKHKNVSINSQCEHALQDKNGVHYICVKGELKNNRDYKELERMAFNAHLVWTRSLNAELERKKKQYLSDYYHASCISNVLSIKYKLHSFGIDLSEDVYKAAREFRGVSGSAKRKMMAAEHRRWVTEKLCDGWVNMPIEDSLQYNDTKDIFGKRHVCILRSCEDDGLIGKWANHDAWDNADENALSELDELDSMSVRLHQACRKYADILSADFRIENSMVNDFLEELDGWKTVQRSFLEWHECLTYLFNGFVNHENGKDEWSIAEYDLLYARLLNELDVMDNKLEKQVLRNKFMAIHNAFVPIARCLKYHDYKRNDKDLINNIPFILTYTEDITMVVPMDYKVLVSKWDDVQPTRLFSYVAAATVVNPKELYLPYIVLAGEENSTTELISQKEQSIKEYVKRKGLRTKVHFVRLEGKSDIRNILGINEDEKLEGWLLVENNESDAIIGKEWGQISEFADEYAFDMMNASFKTTDMAEWLNNIHGNVGITVRDVAGFLGRGTSIKEQPSFRRVDNRILFGIYNSDRTAWREICALLKTSEHKNRDIVKFKKPSNSEKKDLERHIYFMPYVCYKSACLVLQALKDGGIIKGDSYVYRYSADACKTIIFEDGGYGEDLKKLFTRQELLSLMHKYRLHEVNGKLVLICDSLTVEEILFDFHENKKTEKMLLLLEELQRAGFIQLKVKKKSFDIIYGSWQIKELFMEEGNFLEIYTFYKSRETNAFDDVITGVEFYRGDEKSRENEIDCFVTKGFQTIIVECKARALKKDTRAKEELAAIKKELQNKVKKYGINGSGLLVLDSETGVPNVEDVDEVTVCSEMNEITNIGQTVYGQIKKFRRNE